MDRTIKLRLRDSKGIYHDYFQDFVPYSKRLEYIRLERDLQANKDAEGNLIEPSTDAYEDLQAEFVATLFNDKKVTKEAILNGLDSQDKEIIYEIVRYRVLGYTKEEDDKTKKALEELVTIQAGKNSTTSNSISSEE